MKQHAMLQRGLSRHTLPSSNNTRPRRKASAYTAVKCNTHSIGSTEPKAAYSDNMHAADMSRDAASSSRSSIFPVVQGQLWLQAAALALLQLHLVSDDTIPTNMLTRCCCKQCASEICMHSHNLMGTRTDTSWWSKVANCAKTALHAMHRAAH
jgi:hypothetical protein